MIQSVSLGITIPFRITIPFPMVIIIPSILLKNGHSIWYLFFLLFDFNKIIYYTLTLYSNSISLNFIILIYNKTRILEIWLLKKIHTTHTLHKHTIQTLHTPHTLLIIYTHYTLSFYLYTLYSPNTRMEWNPRSIPILIPFLSPFYSLLIAFHHTKIPHSWILTPLSNKKLIQRCKSISNHYH